tara:strand:+ start:638 stop:1348 length:711 start_codon:yes stop_codon:yes gene_type:complete
MHLVTNGCSHTAGAEIEYTRQGECYDKAWPKHLADMWGYDHTNLSISGGSQKRIIRTTIEFIGNYLLDGKDLTELFVIVLWPGPYRTELYIPDNPGRENNQWHTLVVGNDYKSYSKDINNFYKYWVLTYDTEQANVSYLLDVITFQSYLKFWKIKYFFYKASTTPLSSDENHLSYQAQIDNKYFPGNQESKDSYDSVLHRAGFEYSKFTKYAHFGEDGHRFFAKYLDKMIRIAHNI